MPVMNDRPREELLGYLLGALEDQEQEAVQKQLKQDATLRQQLTDIQAALRPLEAGKLSFIPPAGLAGRTCQWIAAQSADAASLRSETAAPPPKSQPISRRRPQLAPALLGDTRPAVETSGNWSWIDLAVAASILAAAFLLLFPAIENSRFQAQVVACQDNLRQLGVALVQYSQANRDYFPYVPTKGRSAAAGIYAPILIDAGYLMEPRTVVCPGSWVADETGFAVPTLEQLQSAEPGEQLSQLRETMGGSYGYSLGYVVNGLHQATRNLGRSTFALLADAPDYGQDQFQSLNHGGRGQNVLFEDGRVVFLPTPKPNQQADDLFLNDTGFVAAGTHENDSVIGGSSTPPLESSHIGLTTK